MDHSLPSRAPRRFRLTPSRIVAAVLVVVVVGLAVWLRTRGPAVDVVPAHRAPVVDRVVATGRVLPSARIRVGSLVLGRVTAVDADEGAEVKAGDVLVALDDSQEKASVAEAEATLRQAEAKLAQVGGVATRVAMEKVRQAAAREQQAKADLDREQALLASGASTRERVESAQKSYDIAASALTAEQAQATGSGPGGVDRRAAAASVAQAQAAVQLARARLAEMRITAPADCVVLERDVEPGDVVQPGHPLLVLATTGWTGLTVQVDEKNLALLQVGERAWASADAFPSERFEATVSFIAPSVDASKGTIEVKLEVPNPPAYIRPDMTVSVSIDGGKRDDVLLIPSSAVRDGSTSPYVFVVRNDRIERKSVQLGARAGDRMEVARGIDDGEAVVLSDGRALSEGQRVRPRTLQPEEASRAL